MIELSAVQTDQLDCQRNMEQWNTVPGDVSLIQGSASVLQRSGDQQWIIVVVAVVNAVLFLVTASGQDVMLLQRIPVHIPVKEKECR